MVIVAGLYMVLWGMSKDQTPPDGEKAVSPTAEQGDLEALPVSLSATGNVEMAPYVAADSTKVTPTDEAV